jgi:hypothetical protein
MGWLDQLTDVPAAANRSIAARQMPGIGVSWYGWHPMPDGEIFKKAIAEKRQERFAASSELVIPYDVPGAGASLVWDAPTGRTV